MNARIRVGNGGVGTKIKLLLAAVLCSVALAGCTPLESNVENLMRPPKLTELQTKVDSALREAVGQDFLLKYPIRGQYRSAFNFLDMNEDGTDEAVAFLSTGDDTLRIALLRQESGRWIVSDLVPGHSFCTEVDFVELYQIGDRKRLLVGWGGTGRENNLLSIYDYDNESGAAPTLSTQPSRWDYSQLTVTDMDQNGKNEILLLIAEDSYDDTVPSAQLVGENSDGLLDLLAETELARNIASFYPPVVGNLGNNLYGAAVDARLGNGKLCTLTIAYAGRELLLPLNELTEQGLFKKTIRNQTVLSCDLNQDGIVDIPVERPAEGYLPNADNAVYFIDYSNLQGDALVPLRSAYFNPARGYRLLLPESWSGHPVSVLVQPDNSEAIFFINSSGNLYDHSKELLRIQVHSTLDGQDKLSQDRQFSLAAKGTFVYSASLPLTPIDTLSPTRNEVKDLFSLTNEKIKEVIP